MTVARPVTPMERRLRVAAMGCALIGLIGVADTVDFYMTGSVSWGLPAFGLAVTWSWGTLYVSAFLIGIAVSFGLRARVEAFRIVGLVFAVLNVFAAIVLLAIDLPQAIAAGSLLGALNSVLLAAAFLAFGVWLFRVLNGTDVRAHFARDPDPSLPGVS